jgi:2-oxoglutarate ferredoxin oxidoreductase subunit beta
MAISHRGAALVDVLQPCVTYNDIHTAEYYRERVYRIEEEGWDPMERWEKTLEALRRSMEDDARIPIGIFYQDPTRDTLEDRIAGRLPSYLARPPALQKIEDNGRPIITWEIFRKVFAPQFVETETAP